LRYLLFDFDIPSKAFYPSRVRSVAINHSRLRRMFLGRKKGEKG
jgi:hypothetical protein